MWQCVCSPHPFIATPLSTAATSTRITVVNLQSLVYNKRCLISSFAGKRGIGFTSLTVEYNGGAWLDLHVVGREGIFLGSPHQSHQLHHVTSERQPTPLLFIAVERRVSSATPTTSHPSYFTPDIFLFTAQYFPFLNNYPPTLIICSLVNPFHSRLAKFATKLWNAFKYFILFQTFCAALTSFFIIINNLKT